MYCFENDFCQIIKFIKERNTIKGTTKHCQLPVISDYFSLIDSKISLIVLTKPR